LREALLALLDRDVERAEAALSDAARRDPDAIWLFLALGKLYRRRGDFARAIRVHQNVLVRGDLAPEQRLEALLDLGEDFRRGGFLRRAIACFEEVAAHDPRHQTALARLAALHGSVREFEAARAATKKLARVEGRDGREAEARLRVDEASAARAEGRSEDARRSLKRALRLAPEMAEAWLELGIVEGELGRTKAALEAWKRVAELDPRQGPRVYPLLAATFAAVGRAREHETFLAGILERHPDDATARLALARALAARGAVDEALDALRQILERDPDQLEAHAALGAVLVGAHRDAEALRAYGELLRALEAHGLAARETSE
jgi:lipopolysaccharide biosynthesis regulator YciM